MEQKQRQQNNKRLLVVDDEAALGDIIKLILEDSGYDVVVEDNGAGALKNFSENGREFDLVITDRIMPDMSGFEVALELKKIRPDIPVIMCSGSSPLVMPDWRISGIQDYLTKPFTAKELVRLVEEVLERTEKGLLI